MIAPTDVLRILDKPELIPAGCKLGGRLMLVRVVIAEGEFWLAEEDVFQILGISEIKGRVVEFLSPEDWACAELYLAGIGEQRVRLMTRAAVQMLAVAQSRRLRIRRDFITWLGREVTQATFDVDRHRRAQGLLHAFDARPLSLLSMEPDQWLH